MRKALGRGLDALIPSKKTQVENTKSGGGVHLIPLAKIRPNRLQPRKKFNQEALQQLAQSMQTSGLAQPIVVTSDQSTGEFDLIAGERRLRAAKMLGWKEIEAHVRAEVAENQKLELALIENLQREDLNPIEQALGFLRLIKEFQFTQNQIADVVGKSRPAVANMMRLLDLPEEIQNSVSEGTLSEGHARALLAVEDPLQRRRLWEKTMQAPVSVRELEEIVRRLKDKKAPKEPLEKSLRHREPVELRELEAVLRQKLGTKVLLKLAGKKGHGFLRIHFFSMDDLDRIVKLLVLNGKTE
ncbi:MAG: hypothetical protein A3G41_06710 [Elusimicrobia bacterium RIFCSPLOWO2_12_FULL_59_9]|nr:MAG: hypothetical protein A3G41_06710 [Elusimicrobia bacterium RIFCSPLOWO2_12_FULL_59_9]